MDTKTPKERLLISLRKGNAEKVAAIIKQFPEELSPDMDADSAENKLLHRAARYGHASVIQTLLDLGANSQATNKFGMTPLHHAAVHGSSEVIVCLLKGGCPVNQPDNAGRLPLHWTATKGHVEGALELLNGGADATGADKEGFTPLHRLEALFLASPQVIKILHCPIPVFVIRCAQEEPEESTPAQQQLQDQQGVSQEEEMAKLERKKEQERHKAELAAELLKRGANVAAEESKGNQTPLHLAAMNGMTVVAEVLLENGAEMDKMNKIGQTALIYACIEKHVDMAKLLLKYGANPCIGNPLHWDWAPLHWAALSDNKQLVQVILDGGGRNSPDKAGRTPAVLAEEHEKLNVLNMLQALPVVK